MPGDEPLEQGRAAYERHDWTTAYARLSSADQDTPLAGADLERLATSAHLVGDTDRCIDLMGRANRAAMADGNPVTAARTAFWVGFHLSFKGEMAQAGGWLGRAQRMLDDCDGPNAIQGYLLVPAAVGLLETGEPARARSLFAQVLEIGERFQEPDLLALGRLGQGQALIKLGDVAAGAAFLDEAMVAVTAEELSAVVSGLVYCAVIEACHEMFDISRAREWTSALSQWCRSQPGLVPYRGQCLVHRAEIMQLNGAWPDAMAEAERARALLATTSGGVAQGAALYQQAELHRLRGEHTAAEEAYRQAGRWGQETQPGLALLRLAQGEGEASLAGVRRALDEDPAPIVRPRLLAAYVDIALALHEVGPAREASSELTRVAEELAVPFLDALAAQARAAVALEDGDPRTALTAARRAWLAWQRLTVPYQAARSRVLVGRASAQLGDQDTARVELDAARTVFTQLHAATDLAALPREATRDHDGNLSPRELEVLRLVASGRSNRAIAEHLVLSEKTVARHVANIFLKLDLSSRSAATAYAFQHHLV